jgi:hypothetical protein
MIAVSLFILTISVIGLLLVLAVDHRSSVAELLGLSPLYGTGVTFIVLLLLSMVSVTWSLPVLASCLVAVAALAFWALKRRRAASRQPIRLSPIDVATLIAIAIYARYSLLMAGSHWDFFAIWGLKGRVFFEAGTIDWRFLTSRWNEFAHPDYPPLLPLNYVALALAEGGWDDRWVGMLSVTFAAAVLLVIRGAAAREGSGHVAAAITLGCAAFALSPAIGLADGPLIAFGTAAVLMIRRGLADGDDIAMFHGGVLLGLAGATKNEGLALIVAASIAVGVAGRRWRPVAQLWPALALTAPWLVLRAIHSLRTDLAAPGAMDRFLARLPAFPQLASAMTTALSLRLVWCLALLSLLLLPLPAIRRELFVLATLAIELAFFTLAYLVTPLDAAWHVATSFGRISSHLGAPFVYVVMSGLAQSFRTQKNPSS